MVTFVETAVTVWVQIRNESNASELMEMSRQLQTVCPAAIKVSENPDLTKVYLQLCRPDEIARMIGSC